MTGNHVLLQPDPEWVVGGGFDHRKTSPTALLRSYIDFEGNIIFAGELLRQYWARRRTRNRSVISGERFVSRPCDSCWITTYLRM